MVFMIILSAGECSGNDEASVKGLHSTTPLICKEVGQALPKLAIGCAEACQA